MKNFKKLFSVLLTFVLLITMILPVSASGTDDELIIATDELIIQLAENFANAVSEVELEAKNPMKFYDQNEQAIGYIVNYYYGEVPYGYVIFDNTHEDFISEYSISENAKSPYDVIIDKSENINNFRSLNDNKLYKTRDYTYGLVNNEGNIEDNYGEIEDASMVLEPQNRSGKKPGWNDVFLSVSTIYQNYTFVTSNNIGEFTSLKDDTVTDATGHYCCLVSAAYICATYYGATNWSDLGNEYMELWDLAGAYDDGSGNGDIILGAAPRETGAKSVVDFCAERGISLSHTHTQSPAFSFFTNYIDRGDIGMFHGAINTAQGRSGHAMAAQGYAVVKNSAGSRLNLLMVADGWGTEVRFLNFNFSYLDTAGTAYRI